MNAFISKQHTREFLKFAVIGVLSTLLNYGVFYASLTKLGFYYLAASATGYCLGIIFSYTCNRLWTFTPTMENRVREFIFYVIVCLVSLGISLIVLKILVAYFSLNPLIANIFAIGTSAICNFIGLKLFVFKTKKPSIYENNYSQSQ